MQPRIYSSSEHPIKPQQIDRDALYVLAKLNQAGYLAYLVGGSVRDLLMGKTPKDFDIATSAKPEEIKKIFSNCLLIGRRFRLAHLRFGKKIIEVSTFRAGDNTDSELILRDNVWGTPEEDVLRRDFTINGLYYDPKEHSIIDYVGGWEDLQKHLLRTIGIAEIRFKQDPVRMIRLLKFKARFDFHIDAEAAKAMDTCRRELEKSSPARLLEEFLKMLESGSAFPFLSLLEENGFLKILFPNLEHTKLNSYLKAVDLMIQKEKQFVHDRSVLLATLFFPLIEKRIHPATTYPEVMELTDSVLTENLSSAFFPLPKRLRHLTQFILNAQYRLVLPSGKKPLSYRILRHPDFHLTLQFLHIRSQAFPELLEMYHSWNTHKVKKRPSKNKHSHAPKT